jgi:hypothetical protein
MKTGVSYFARTRLKHMEEDMEAIKRNHCSFVVHTFSEADLEFYKGAMARLVTISHEKGLEVWIDPWAVGGIFGGESYSQFACCNLDARQVSSHGDILPAACFNSHKFRAYIKEWVNAAIEIGADTIFWDEPHFYIYEEHRNEDVGTALWACRCTSCQERFKERYSYELPLTINEDVQAFKEDSIVDFITEMCDYVKTKGRINSFCFLPIAEPVGGVRNWEKFAQITSLDTIGTDPYWKTDIAVTEEEVREKVSLFSRKIKTLCDTYKKEGQIWILNFRIKAGTEHYITAAVDTAHREGIRNIAAWSYYGTEMMASHTSDNPALVWKTLGNAFKKLLS